MSEPLYDPVEIEFAKGRVRDSGFPISADAASLLRLDADEPFLTYVLAASEALRLVSGPLDPVALSGAMHALVDRIAAWTTLSTEATPLACRVGCNFCCSLRVNVLWPEVETIRQHIATRFSDEAKAQLASAVDEFLHEANQLSPEQRAVKPILCPLNRGGHCTIYEVRPMTCRNHHSLSVSQCQSAFERWQENLPVTRIAMRKLCGEIVMEAFMDVLEFCGHDSRVFDLPSSLKAG